MDLSRRNFLVGATLCLAALLFAGPLACARRRFKRPAATLDLGEASRLLWRRVHVRERAVLVFRDEKGWSVLSTRCTYEGCDLSVHDEYLICPCCHSRFAFSGKVLEGPAPDPLPWLTMFYKDGHLFADAGARVELSYRYTTPELEQAIVDLGIKIREQGISDEVKVPKILLGEGDRQPGQMFKEDDPNFAHDLEMIR